MTAPALPCTVLDHLLTRYNMLLPQSALSHAVTVTHTAVAFSNSDPHVVLRQTGCYATKLPSVFDFLVVQPTRNRTDLA